MFQSLHKLIMLARIEHLTDVMKKKVSRMGHRWAIEWRGQQNHFTFVGSLVPDHHASEPMSLSPRGGRSLWLTTPALPLSGAVLSSLGRQVTQFLLSPIIRTVIDIMIAWFREEWCNREEIQYVVSGIDRRVEYVTQFRELNYSCDSLNVFFTIQINILAWI